MPPPKPLKILVVDDDLAMREMVRALLRAGGYEVVGEASDGTTAVALCRERQPDVVLLDIMLRDSNGLETIENLHAENPAASVVILSGNAYPDVIEQARAKGARGFIAKPFNAQRILKAIERATSAPAA